jgi:hypothetical protein
VPRLPALALLLLSAVVAAAAPIPEAKQAEVYFPTQAGAKAVYTIPGGTQTETVASVQSKDGAKLVTVAVVQVYTDGRRSGEYSDTFKVSAAGVEWAKTTLFETDGSALLLKLPHDPNAKWESAYKAKSANELFWSPVKLAYKTGAAGKVTTHAGTFQAFPVEQKRVDLPGGGVSTTWYAAGVGKVKQVDLTWVRLTDREPQRIETVLKSFTPGKD